MPQNNEVAIGPLIVQLTQVIADVGILLAQILISIVLSVAGLFTTKPLKSVRGEKVLVTGAGHGIGKELALLYAAEGATVIIWDINEENAKETAKLINKSANGKAYAFKCDVSDRESVLRVADEVRRVVGDVTILINNAGILPCHPLLEHTSEEIERVMKVNVLAHFWTLEAFLPAMKAQNHGHIVALSSSAGLVGVSNMVPYCSSKFAVRGLMEALFQELREDKKSEIKLTSVYPFIVDTGLVKKPYIRFKNLLPIVEPKDAASAIINAQRKELNEISIPRSLFYSNLIGRLLPIRAQLATLDFLNMGAYSDLQ